MFFWGDYTFIYILPAIIVAMWAQGRVSAAFGEASRIRARAGLTGAQVARAILDRAGLHDVPVERVPGQLTDHYDPRARVLRLSQPVYDSASLAALGVAAHEAGHALQHQDGYAFLGMRSALYPVANLGSNLAWPLVLMGFLFPSQIGLWLMDAGIFLFLGAVIFTVITLPVEYNASARAVALLEGGGFVSRDELGPAKKVLDAAALTYVAATLIAVLQLVRLLVLRRARSD